MKKCFSLFLVLPFCTMLAAQVDSTKPVHEANSIFSIQTDSIKNIGKEYTGKASVYSRKADGSKTSSGEIFKNESFTAATNKFKLGSWIRVTNLANHKEVIVRVNDRTSKSKTAPVVQLSLAAVKSLGFLKAGSCKIKMNQIYLNHFDSVYNIKSNGINSGIDTVAITTRELKANYSIIGKPVNGIASFYSSNLDGTKTSTGERYRNNKLTAASNNFNLNTLVLVTNLRNQKTVIVRINDRMHPRMKKKGRIVDLSLEAARQLDFISNGLTRVKVEPIVMGDAPETLKDPEETDSIKLIPGNDSISLSPHQSIADSSLIAATGVQGKAGVYNSELDGHKTASGKIYRENKLSAASNVFPLNTKVRVTNLVNKNSIVLVINDSLHPKMLKSGRVLFVSKLAAKKLGFMKKGVALVKIEQLGDKELE